MLWLIRRKKHVVMWYKATREDIETGDKMVVYPEKNFKKLSLMRFFFFFFCI